MRAVPRRQRTQEAEHRLVSHSQNFRFHSAVRTGAECCDERVCVCPHGITCQNFTIFTHTYVTCGRASVLIWRRCNTLCILVVYG